MIATPKIAKDTFFHRSLVYVDKHSSEGALGFIVNKPTDIKVAELLKTVGISEGKDYQAISRQPVHIGGPVNQNSLYILYQSQDDAPSDEPRVKISSSEKTLKALCAGEGPERYLILLGCSSWGAGQLEHEYQDNSWIYLKCIADIVFHSLAEERAKLAAQHLGFDLNTLVAS